MWKVTVTQNKKSEYVEGYIPNTIEFTAETLQAAASIVEVLSLATTEHETLYKIEKTKKEESENESL